MAITCFTGRSAFVVLIINVDNFILIIVCKLLINIYFYDNYCF